MNMTKGVEATVDIDVARMMLQVAGYSNIHELSDDEVFDKALTMNEEYGVTYVIKGT